MPRVQLHGPLRFNLSGNDRTPVVFPAGEQDVPDVVAAFLIDNPALGDILVPVSEPVAPVSSEGVEPESGDGAGDGEGDGDVTAEDATSADEDVEPETEPATEPEAEPEAEPGAEKGEPVPAPKPQPKRRR